MPVKTRSMTKRITNNKVEKTTQNIDFISTTKFIIVLNIIILMICVNCACLWNCVN